MFWILDAIWLTLCFQVKFQEIISFNISVIYFQILFDNLFYHNHNV